MVLGALMFAFLALPLCALGVDTARWWVEAQRIQAAADAASTAGVTYMPEDFAKAKARALEVAKLNGYQPGTGVTITVTNGAKPTQLKVTISSTVDNFFAKSFGVDDSTITRSAVADFNGPAPMGSPCNVFGNEPAGTTFSGPVGSALKTPPLATCANPQFWGSISGPEVWKDQGSQFETRKCGGTEDGCVSSGAGAANAEFDPRGFIYLVRVAPSAVGQSIQLQLFDPAYASTYLVCNSQADGSGSPYPSGTETLTNAWNSYVTDGIARYTANVTSFCTGDDPNANKRFPSTANVPTITSFGLRSPTDTLNPFAGPPMSNCVKQFPGYDETKVSRANLKKQSTGTLAVNDPLARVFRQWVNLCTFTPTQAGDYYLQVRSNVKMGGTISAVDGTSTGNMNVFNQAGDDLTVKGTGTNSFGIRAVSSAGAGAVSVSPSERMRIFANANSATSTFNLVKVIPAAQNKSLIVTFFDVGEGASNGSVRLIPPADATNLGTTMSRCTASGVTTTGSGAYLSNCQISGINLTTYNGKLQTIRVPISNTYSCNTTSQGGCWWRVEVKFGAGNVRDATTWTARIAGEPIRLID